MLIDIHTHRNHTGNPDLLAIRNLSPPEATGDIPPGWFSIGFHPWDSGDRQPDYALLETAAGMPGCLAIGECGIDRLRGAEIDMQLGLFRQQALIAAKLGKPVIIHCVKAWQELVSLKKEIDPKVAWIIHGFTGKPELARQLGDLGFYLSFGAAILRPGGQAVASLRQADAGRFFLETDDSGTPIEQIYHAAAMVKNVSLESITTQISVNLETAYGIRITPGMASTDGTSARE